MSDYIYHITSEDKWQDAQGSGEYIPIEYLADGFIHASYYHQLKQVLDFLFSAQDSVLVLEIDPLYLQAEIRVENTTGGKEKFPHIFGTLSTSAVVRTFTLTQGKEGFIIPQPEAAH